MLKVLYRFKLFIQTAHCIEIVGTFSFNAVFRNNCITVFKEIKEEF